MSGKQVCPDNVNSNIICTTTLMGLDPIIERYQPELSEGRWLQPGDTVEAVITDNPYGFQVGDTITLIDYLGEQYAGHLQVRVVGRIKNGTRIYRNSSLCQPESATDLFEIFDPEHNVADAADFLIYINKNTLDYIRKKMETILPMLLCAFILVSLCIAVHSAISTYEEQDFYAISFLCGMKWSGILLIKFMESLVAAALGLGMFVLMHNLLRITGLIQRFHFHYDPSVPYLFGAVLIYWIILKTFTAIVSIHKKSCTELLRKAKL